MQGKYSHFNPLNFDTPVLSSLIQTTLYKTEWIKFKLQAPEKQMIKLANSVDQDGATYLQTT